MQDAIWRMMAWISRMISLSLFSFTTLTTHPITSIRPVLQKRRFFSSIRFMTESNNQRDGRRKDESERRVYPFSTTSPSVTMLKFQRSSTSAVALLMMTRTIL